MRKLIIKNGEQTIQVPSNANVSITEDHIIISLVEENNISDKIRLLEKESTVEVNKIKGKFPSKAKEFSSSKQPKKKRGRGRPRSKALFTVTQVRDEIYRLTKGIKVSVGRGSLVPLKSKSLMADWKAWNPKGYRRAKNRAYQRLWQAKSYAAKKNSK